MMIKEMEMLIVGSDMCCLHFGFSFKLEILILPSAICVILFDDFANTSYLTASILSQSNYHD